MSDRDSGSLWTASLTKDTPSPLEHLTPLVLQERPAPVADITERLLVFDEPRVNDGCVP